MYYQGFSERQDSLTQRTQAEDRICRQQESFKKILHVSSAKTKSAMHHSVSLQGLAMNMLRSGRLMGGQKAENCSHKGKCLKKFLCRVGGVSRKSLLLTSGHTSSGWMADLR